MGPEGERQFILCDAIAVIADLQQLHAASEQLDLYCSGVRVKAVFEQFFQRCGRAIDHLSRRDLADQQFIE